MRRAGLYLNDQRFEADSVEFQLSHDVPYTKRRRRVYIPALRDVMFSATAHIPKGWRISRLDDGDPVRVRWRKFSGLFYLDADVDTRSRTIHLQGVAAGPFPSC